MHSHSMLLCRAVLVPFGLLVALTRAPAREPARSFGSLVPDRAVLYVEIDRPGEILDWLSSPRVAAALQANEGYRNFLQSAKYQQLQAAVKHFETQLHTTWQQGLQDLTARGVALAVIPRTGAAATETSVLLVRAKDGDLLRRLNQALIQAVGAEAMRQGKPSPVKSTDDRGVTVYQLSNDEAHAVVGTCLVVANRPEAVRAVLDRRAAGDDRAGLAANPAWRAARARAGAAGRRPLGWAFVNLDPIKKTPGMARALDPRQENLLGILLLGGWMDALRQAGSLSLVVQTEPGGLHATVRVPRDPAQTREPFKAFFAPPTDGPLPLLSPPRTLASLSLYRNTAALWSHRSDLVTEAVQSKLAQFDSGIAPFLGGREFGSGVLDQLTPHLRFVVADQDYRKLKVAPDIKIPGFGLVLELKEHSGLEDRLVVAFQSFIGLTNLQAGKEGNSPMRIVTEEHHGVPISIGRFTEIKKTAAGGVDQRYNFSPAVAQVGRSFVFTSTAELAADLVEELQRPARPVDGKDLILDARGGPIARYLAGQKTVLVHKNMISKGQSQAEAEREIGTLIELVRGLGDLHGTVSAEPHWLRLDLQVRGGSAAAPAGADPSTPRE